MPLARGTGVKLQTELEISGRGANEWGILKDPHGKDPQTIHPATESGHLARTPRRTRAGFGSVRQAQAASHAVYQWQKAFFENGAAAFESRRACSQSLSQEEGKIAALEAKLRNKTEVLAELVEELVRTKKELGET